jgi:hypothetical protein
MIDFSARLLPAPIDGGYREADYWIWCGSVIRGEDGQYHMFASRIPKELPFSPHWVTNSEVVRATSPSAEGPYTFAEVVLPPREGEYWDSRMTHNPTIHFHGGKYYLYYTGTTYTGPTPSKNFMVDQSHPMRVQARRNQRVGVATATSILGPWTRRDKPLLEPRPGKWDALMTTNPAPFILDDGRCLLAYKAVAYDKDKLRYGVVWGESPLGPFEKRGQEPVLRFTPDVSIEDAYLWREAGRLYMLFNDLEGHVTGEDHAGGLGESDDGIHWRISEVPKAYSRRVKWNDGTETIQGSFERPQLLIQEGVPTHLFAATADGPGGFARATELWNMVVPLRDH